MQDTSVGLKDADSRYYQDMPEVDHRVTESAPISPNLKLARQRLITDVYGSAGMTLGTNSAAPPLPNERWKPSRRGATDPSKRLLQIF